MNIVSKNGPRMRELPALRRVLIVHSGVVSIAVFLLFCVVAFSVATDSFLTPGNLLNLARQSAPMLIVAVAMTLVITTGGIDLSIGSTLALVGALSASALSEWNLPWPLVLVAGVALGALIGAVNGYFVAYERVPAFIVTLATLTVVRGLGLLLTQGYSVPVPTDSAFVAIGAPGSQEFRCRFSSLWRPFLRATSRLAGCVSDAMSPASAPMQRACAERA
jgi:simple sugar transport system permease protein